MKLYQALSAVALLSVNALIAGCYGTEQPKSVVSDTVEEGSVPPSEPAEEITTTPSADEKTALVLSKEYLLGNWSVTSYQVTEGGVTSELLNPSKPIALVFGAEGWVRLDYLNPLKPDSTPQQNYDIVDGKLSLLGLAGFDFIWSASLSEGEMTLMADNGKGVVTRASLKKIDDESPWNLADLAGNWRVESVSIRSIITGTPGLNQEKQEVFTPKVELLIAAGNKMSVHQCTHLHPYEGVFNFNSKQFSENAYFQNGEIRHWDLAVSGDTMLWKNRDEIPEGILEITITWKKASAPICEPSDVIVYQ